VSLLLEKDLSVYGKDSVITIHNLKPDIENAKKEKEFRPLWMAFLTALQKSVGH
jgi:hypothetical protein